MNELVQKKCTRTDKNKSRSKTGKLFGEKKEEHVAVLLFFSSALKAFYQTLVFTDFGGI